MGVQPTTISVVAAVIERDGRVLICQRAAHDSHPLKWEFPGGKVRGGETPAEALLRELHEELGVRAEICGELTRYRWQYSGADPIELVFYRARLLEGEPVNRVFAQIRWESPAKLVEYDFLEADRQFILGLAARTER